MGIQDDAAQMLAQALSARHLNTKLAWGRDPSVSIREYPEAVVQFTTDHLGGLRTKFVFDGRPPVYLDFTPTPSGAAALAQYILDQIAGDGGRSLL